MKQRAMYIISGKLKGRRIECPPGEIRPMTGLCRKALFSILGDLTGKTMLDLFSGSGIIALEGISHGIETADLVEFDYNKKPVLTKNLSTCGIVNSKTFFGDALAFCERAEKKYDLITADPPFKYTMKERMVEVIGMRSLLSDNGILMIHITSKETLPEKIGGLLLYDRRKYGINVLLFYKKDVGCIDSVN